MAVLAGGVGALVGLLGTGTAATIAKVALSVAAIGLQILLAPRPPKAPRPDDLRTTKRSEEGPGRWAIGRVELEGQIVFGNTSGYDLYQVILHAFGPIDAIEEYFYDGRPVIVETTTHVSSPPYGREGGSFLHLETKIGDGTEGAWTDLVSTFDDYTEDHKIRGIAQTRLWAVNPGTTAESWSRMFQGGLKPVRLRARISLFQHPWDPRTEDRAWTLNAVLIAAHIRALLPGASFDDIDWLDMEDMADDADAAVTTLSSTAPRATLSGGGEGAITVDVMLDMLRSAGLEEVLAADGKVRFAWLDDYPAAELHLTSDHILSITVQRGPEGVRRPNVCRIKYLSPERQYTVAELPVQVFAGTAGAYSGPAWARVQSEVDRYGEHEMTIELPFCPDASQAQRISRRLFWMERADLVEIVTTFAGVAAYGRRTISVDVPDVGTDGAAVTLRARVESWSMDDAAGQCRLVCRVIPTILQTAWNASSDEVAPPPELTPAAAEGELDTPNAPSAAIDVGIGDGSSRQLRVAFEAVEGAVTAEANFRTYTGAVPNLWQGMGEIGTGLAVVSGDYRGQKLDLRVRMFDEDGNGSYFSDLLEIASLSSGTTAPGTPSGLSYALDGEGAVASISVTAPASLTVVAVQILQGDTFETASQVAYLDATPSQAFTVTSGFASPAAGETETWWAVAFATGGTAGGNTSTSYTRPGGEP